MRLIDADIMRENLEWCKSESGRYNDIYWDDVIERLDVQPTVDAAPVKHGRWIENEGFDGDCYYTCSVCKCDWTTIDGTPTENNMRYCPECGAKMDLEEQDAN